MSDEKQIQQFQGDPNIMGSSEAFEHVQRVAKVFAASTMVPEHYRGVGNLGNCIIAINLAHALGLNPLMVMQRSYVVGGRPGLESQVVIGLVNQHGPFDAPIRHEYEYAEDGSVKWCTAIANIGEREYRTRITAEMVKANGWDRNAKWRTIAEQMYAYRSSVFLARRYCPEVLMGVYTNDELEDIQVVDARPALPRADTVRPAWGFDAETSEPDSSDGGSFADEISEMMGETNANQ